MDSCQIKGPFHLWYRIDDVPESNQVITIEAFYQ